MQLAVIRRFSSALGTERRKESDELCSECVVEFIEVVKLVADTVRPCAGSSGCSRKICSGLQIDFAIVCNYQIDPARC